jgi:hypothetical protein
MLKKVNLKAIVQSYPITVINEAKLWVHRIVALRRGSAYLATTLSRLTSR